MDTQFEIQTWYERGNNVASRCNEHGTRAPKMKIELVALRLTPALYRCLTAIGLAALVVGLMVVSKGGGV
jgi:hypothetical protein